MNPASIIRRFQACGITCLIGAAPASALAEGQVQVGVERLFGVAGYHQSNVTQSDFGDFATEHTGVQLQAFGATAARGDNQDGVNLSGMPRLRVGYEWQNGWSLTTALGFLFSTGQRTLESSDEERDPYLYPSRFGTVGALYGGKLWMVGQTFGLGVQAGPQLTFSRASGDGSERSVTAIQASLMGVLVYQPFAHFRLLVQPYADIGVWGRSMQRLRVAGVPETKLVGDVWQNGFGLALGFGVVF